jgi:threonine dehydrogenase-like Zn-dependent dehydrogenase
VTALPRSAFTIVQTAVRTLEPRDVLIPDIDDDSAILRIEACGICGSDYEQFEGQLRTPMPVVPGHEPLGRIAKIGDRAARRWHVDVGDRVAVETMLSCRHCGPCLSGSYHLCDTRRIYSYIPLSEPPGLWGAYSQYMYLAPNTIVHRVDPTLSPQVAVMFNPLGAGFRWAVEMPNTRPGDSVVILGPGQRGLACVVACREVGAGTIIVTGLAADANKLALARVFGADHTIDVDNEDPIARVKEITHGRGADIVVDVSSYATKPVADAMSMVRPGGTVVLAGVKGFKAVDNFVSDLVVMKEISIKGAIGVTSTGYKAAIRLIESGRTPIAQMHTHDFDLADAALAIRTLARQVPGDESIHSCLIPPH